MSNNYCLSSCASVNVILDTLDSLHPEIGGIISDDMDIKSLCQWRATCRQNYLQGTASLRRSLMKVLNGFVHDPSNFMSLITRHNALIGGEVALAFILRDSTYFARSLEIFAGQWDFSALCKAVLDGPLVLHIQRTTRIEHPRNFALQRLVSETLHIELVNGGSIHIHSSFTCTAISGIARSLTTGLSNYVSGQGFGCSHPRLTLQRRALLSDIALDTRNALDFSVMNNMVTQGFHLSVTPSAWPEYRYSLADNATIAPFQCWRELYICPSMGRFFGDAGSFVNYFDPLAGDAAICVSRSLPPYGSMLIWRLMTTFHCSDSCDELDEFLGNGLTSVPVLFVHDFPGRAKDILVDRRVHATGVPAVERARDRSRSL